MQVTFTVPDEMVSGLAGDSDDLSRIALEAFAVQGYRCRRLSAFEVRQLLGHASRWETENFLAAHEVWPGLTEEDLAEELKRIKVSQPA